MTMDLATTPLAENVELALIGGNLANLKPEERLALYRATCDSLGLNPLTTPFQYITLNGRLVLYATRNCTDQLRSLEGISVAITGRELVQGTYVVTARATIGDRSDESIGAVPLDGLKGEALANAMMKCETKAKRRVTLSIRGLSFIDESEADSIAGARTVSVEEAHATAAPRRGPTPVPHKPPPEQAANAAEYSEIFAPEDEADPHEHLRDMITAMRNASSSDELKRISSKYGASNPSRADRDVLAPVYRDAVAALKEAGK